MKITFLGVGGAFTTADYYHSNILLEHNSKKMLIDCGSDIRFSLAPYGINGENVGEEIDAVYISHLHQDHCGGLEFLGFCSYFNPKAKKPNLFIADDLVEPLWETLRAGMQAHSGKDMTLASYFQVITAKHQKWGVPMFTWGDCVFKLIPTKHILKGNGEFVPSYGVCIMGYEVKPVLVTSDTCMFADSFYKDFDLIFHDCETYPHRSFVHAHYDDLVQLPADIKKKMWLYHYAPDPIQNPIHDGFLGFVQRGQVFEI